MPLPQVPSRGRNQVVNTSCGLNLKVPYLTKGGSDFNITQAVIGRIHALISLLRGSLHRAQTVASEPMSERV